MHNISELLLWQSTLLIHSQSGMLPKQDAAKAAYAENPQLKRDAAKAVYTACTVHGCSYIIHECILHVAVMC